MAFGSGLLDAVRQLAVSFALLDEFIAFGPIAEGRQLLLDPRTARLSKIEFLSDWSPTYDRANSHR